MSERNNMTASFDNSEVAEKLDKQDNYLLNDYKKLEKEDAEIKEAIDLTLREFGLKEAQSFIYEDQNRKQHFVKIVCPSHVKIGNKICVTLFVQENSDNGYVLALGSKNHNWFSNITIEKSDIVSIFDDKKSSLRKIINMATVIKDTILPSLEIGDRFVTKKEDAVRELGRKTPDGELVFIRSVGNSEPKEEKPITLAMLKTRAFAIKKVLRQTDEFGDDGELVYEEMNFETQK